MVRYTQRLIVSKPYNKSSTDYADDDRTAYIEERSVHTIGVRGGRRHIRY